MVEKAAKTLLVLWIIVSMTFGPWMMCPAMATTQAMPHNAAMQTTTAHSSVSTCPHHSEKQGKQKPSPVSCSDACQAVSSAVLPLKFETPSLRVQTIHHTPMFQNIAEHVVSPDNPPPKV